MILTECTHVPNADTHTHTHTQQPLRIHIIVSAWHCWQRTRCRERRWQIGRVIVFLQLAVHDCAQVLQLAGGWVCNKQLNMRSWFQWDWMECLVSI